MAYTNFQNCTQQEYTEIIYSGEANNKLKVLFNGVDYTTINVKGEKLTVTSKILSNGNNRFSLDNFVSKEAELIVHDIDLDEIVEPISISIGTLVDEENDIYEYVPIGVFNLDETPTTDSGKTTIKLRDNSVKFDEPYNAEEIITENGGSATMLQVLQDICTKCGVTLGTQSFVNDSTEISVWDNTINARVYVMYIAEKAGCIATIDRSGELVFVNLKTQTPIELDSWLFEKYTEGKELKIERVVYEDGIRKFEASYIVTEDITYQENKVYYSKINNIYTMLIQDEDYTIGDTIVGTVYEQNQDITEGVLYINSANPYITSQQEIDNIYDSIKGLEMYSMNISKMIGNPAIDPWDILQFTYNNNTYKFLGQNTLTYTKNIIQSFDTQIGTNEKSQENVTINSDSTKFKRVFTKIDQQEGTIELNSSQIANIQTDLQENHYSKEQTDQLILNAESGLTNTFSEAGGNNIFRNTGLWFETKTDENLLYPSNNLYPSDDLFIEQKSTFEFWRGDVIRLKEDRAVNFNALLLQTGTLYQEQLVPNGKYTISFKYQKLLELGNVKCIINDKEIPLTALEETAFQETIEVNSGHINIQFTSDINNSCEIYDLMVNAGEVKLAYSQNQNETTTDTVNISKGITITSSEVDTTFKANADGVRIYANNDLVNPKTKFTDKGTETDYLKVKVEAEVVDILIQRVGSHTWLTKI